MADNQEDQSNLEAALDSFLSTLRKNEIEERLINQTPFPDESYRHVLEDFFFSYHQWFPDEKILRNLTPKRTFDAMLKKRSLTDLLDLVRWFIKSPGPLYGSSFDYGFDYNWETGNFAPYPHELAESNVNTSSVFNRNCTTVCVDTSILLYGMGIEHIIQRVDDLAWGRKSTELSSGHFAFEFSLEEQKYVFDPLQNAFGKIIGQESKDGRTVQTIELVGGDSKIVYRTFGNCDHYTPAEFNELMEHWRTEHGSLDMLEGGQRIWKLTDGGLLLNLMATYKHEQLVVSGQVVRQKESPIIFNVAYDLDDQDEFVQTVSVGIARKLIWEKVIGYEEIPLTFEQIEKVDDLQADVSRKTPYVPMRTIQKIHLAGEDIYKQYRQIAEDVLRKMDPSHPLAVANFQALAVKGSYEQANPHSPTYAQPEEITQWRYWNENSSWRDQWMHNTLDVRRILPEKDGVPNTKKAMIADREMFRYDYKRKKIPSANSHELAIDGMVSLLYDIGFAYEIAGSWVTTQAWDPEEDILGKLKRKMIARREWLNKQCK